MSASSPSIILGISGSIAAYKTPYLVRLLAAQGYRVRVVMTPIAAEFVSPLVLSNLSKQPVSMHMFDEQTQRDGSWHIQAARESNAMLIAPASANTIAALAHGLGSTALSAVALALPPGIPLMIAPAMDTEMWEHPATQHNLHILRSRGTHVIDPEYGELASGAMGMGRLAELSSIVQYVQRILGDRTAHTSSEHAETAPSGAKNYSSPERPMEEKVKDAAMKSSRPLADVPDQIAFQAELELSMLKQQSPLGWWKNRNVLITAGPTRERIDDVRYVSNYSSGTMGFALAEVAARAGANVRVVCGPVQLDTPAGVERIDVESAQEMFDRVREYSAESDVVICSAAVADFRPNVHSGKLKKADLGLTWTLHMQQTEDILSWVGHHKTPSQYVVGFALESEDLENQAEKKLGSKACSMIVANSAEAGKAMGTEDNQVTIITPNDAGFSLQRLERMSKVDCARAILLAIARENTVR